MFLELETTALYVDICDPQKRAQVYSTTLSLSVFNEEDQDDDHLDDAETAKAVVDSECVYKAYPRLELVADIHGSRDDEDMTNLMNGEPTGFISLCEQRIEGEFELGDVFAYQLATEVKSGKLISK